MVGPIAQIVALACFLNTRLREQPVPVFFPTSSTATFCDWIRFMRPGKNEEDDWQVVASSPDQWFDWVAEQKYLFAYLDYSPVNNPRLSDRLSAGFVGGGGRWLLGTAKQGDCDYWQAAWKVWDQKALDRRIWRVEYGLVGFDNEFEGVSKTDLIALSEEFISILSAIEQFARKHQLDGFAEAFALGQKCLRSGDPFALVFHKDLSPDGLLDLNAARLLAACQAASVFGGMGSWNDMSFEGEEGKVYEHLSDSLFALINRAVCAAANSPVAH